MNDLNQTIISDVTIEVVNSLQDRSNQKLKRSISTDFSSSMGENFPKKSKIIKELFDVISGLLRKDLDDDALTYAYTLKIIRAVLLVEFNITIEHDTIALLYILNRFN